MATRPAPSGVHFGEHPFPRTRYQGSKRKLADAIVQHLLDFDFTTVLDAFGGTGAISHALKRIGKRVTYNDALAFNHQIGLALVENNSDQLTPEEAQAVAARHPGVEYDDLIERTFEGIYFTNDENRWLDVAVANIRRLPGRYSRAIAWFSLFQAALAKRPYNLFHRRNLYMRTAEVSRSFGNKASWDRGFADHFAVFAAEANLAVIDTGEPCRAICQDALEMQPGYDLVYIDTPYINRSGTGVDYRDFYHFLEGMVQYDGWADRIDLDSKHRRLVRTKAPWSDPRLCYDAFRRIFDRFRESIIVVSYRSDGIPTIDELVKMLGDVKRRVQVCEVDNYKYALSTKRGTHEILLLGTS